MQSACNAFSAIANSASSIVMTSSPPSEHGLVYETLEKSIPVAMIALVAQPTSLELP